MGRRTSRPPVTSARGHGNCTSERQRRQGCENLQAVADQAKAAGVLIVTIGFGQRRCRRAATKNCLHGRLTSATYLAGAASVRVRRQPQRGGLRLLDARRADDRERRRRLLLLRRHRLRARPDLRLGHQRGEQLDPADPDALSLRSQFSPAAGFGVRGHRRLHGEEPRRRIPARRSSLTTGPPGPPPSPRLLPAPPHRPRSPAGRGFQPPTRPDLAAGGAAEELRRRWWVWQRVARDERRAGSGGAAPSAVQPGVRRRQSPPQAKMPAAGVCTRQGRVLNMALALSITRVTTIRTGELRSSGAGEQGSPGQPGPSVAGSEPATRR